MHEKKYCSKIPILSHSKIEMRKRIQQYLATTPSSSCKYLRGRKVKLERYLDATTPRKDATKRLRTFFVAIDIIKHSHAGTQRIQGKLREYEITGVDRSGTEVRVHIREEVVHADRQLYLISSFPTSQRENPLP